MQHVIEITVQEDHLLRLPKELPTNSRVRVFIETIETPAAEEFMPRTPLGERLLALRKQHIAEGGVLLNPDELLAEMRSRRGGRVMDE